MKLFLSSIFLLTAITSTFAQDDLKQLLETLPDSTAKSKKHDLVYATFKSSRIISARSNETMKKRELDFIIAHRFGDAAGKYGGVKTLFGIDAASDIKIAFDYGITDRLTAGFSRTKGATAIRQLYEGSLKHKLLQQTKDNHIPLSVTLFCNAVVSAMSSNINPRVPDYFDTFSDRWSFVAQTIITRKFNSNFSLAFIPSYIHYNRISYGDQNDNYALGLGGRWKVSKRMAFIGDYFLAFKNRNVTNYFNDNGLSFYNPLGLGIEMETGGHVFQFTFMNSTALLENQFIPYTTTSWTNGQFRWGFSFSRTFAFKKKQAYY